VPILANKADEHTAECLEYQQNNVYSPHTRDKIVEAQLSNLSTMSVAKALSALANQRFLRLGIGAGGAVVTERVLSTAAGVDESMYSWIAGTTAGGAVWGVIGVYSRQQQALLCDVHRVYSQVLRWHWVALLA